MQFTYTVNVDVNRIQGKFATRDEISDLLREAIEEAVDNIDLSSLGPDSTSEYELTDSDVTEEEQPKRVRKPSQRDSALAGATAATP